MGAAMSELDTNSVGENPSTSQYLTFFLNGQEYAVDILKVQGIQGWSSYTALPNTPEHILGVINLRGSIVPILDLRIRFSLSSVEYNDVTVIIVVKIVHGDTEKVIGLVVDAVSEVYNINSDEINVSPDFGADVETDYINGLAMVDEKLVIALNVDKLIGESVLGQIEAEMQI